MEPHNIFEQWEYTYLVPKWWPVAASIYYYAFTICLASILRSITKSIFPKSSAIYVLDLITTFQVCACSLENASVRFYHGLPGYLFSIFCQALIFKLTFKDFRGNPLANVIGYLHKEQSLHKTVIRVMFQVIGGLISYRYAKTLWRFRLNDIHLDRADMLCTNDLTVDPSLGFLVEFGGTIFETYISFCTLTKNPAVDLFIKLIIGVINLTLAVELTGYYLNPANATAQTFGCGGSSPVIFILIYWIGPILATAGAVYLRGNRPSKMSINGSVNGDPEQCNKPKSD